MGHFWKAGAGHFRRVPKPFGRKDTQAVTAGPRGPPGTDLAEGLASARPSACEPGRGGQVWPAWNPTERPLEGCGKLVNMSNTPPAQSEKTGNEWLVEDPESMVMQDVNPPIR